MRFSLHHRKMFLAKRSTNYWKSPRISAGMTTSDCASNLAFFYGFASSFRFESCNLVKEELIADKKTFKTYDPKFPWPNWIFIWCLPMILSSLAIEEIAVTRSFRKKINRKGLSFSFFWYLVKALCSIDFDFFEVNNKCTNRKVCKEVEMQCM